MRDMSEANYANYHRRSSRIGLAVCDIPNKKSMELLAVGTLQKSTLIKTIWREHVQDSRMLGFSTSEQILAYTQIYGKIISN